MIIHIPCCIQAGQGSVQIFCLTQALHRSKASIKQFVQFYKVIRVYQIVAVNDRQPLMAAHEVVDGVKVRACITAQRLFRPQHDNALIGKFQIGYIAFVGNNIHQVVAVLQFKYRADYSR